MSGHSHRPASPPTRRAHPPTQTQGHHSLSHILSNQNTPPGFIDLTADAMVGQSVLIGDSPPQQRSASRTGEPAPKRRRIGASELAEPDVHVSTSRPRGPRRRSLEVDLTVSETEFALPGPPGPPVTQQTALGYSDLLRLIHGQSALPEHQRAKEEDDDQLLKQQRSQHETLQKQQEQRLSNTSKLPHDHSKPVRLSSIQCVVCMENMTNITSTWCGHLFCHTCLMEALIAGENQDSANGKGPSRCPICRKKVVRAKIGGKDPNHVIPLELKLKPKSAVAKGKEKATVCS